MAPSPKIPPHQDDIRARLEQVKRDYADGNQTEMARLTSVQAAELSKMMSGKKRITRPNLEKIEQGMGIRLAWLETGAEPIRHPGGRPPAPVISTKEGEKLRDYVKRNVGTTELARRLGVNKSTVSGYYTSANIEARNRMEILRALDALEDDVFGRGVGESTPAYSRTMRHVVPANEVKLILKIPVRVRAGFDYHTYVRELEHERDYEEIPVSWIKKPHLCQAIIEVDGDSMETTLRAGYEVLAYLVDPSDWDYADDVVAVVYRDQFTIKRIGDNQLMAGGPLVLTSDNTLGGTRRIIRDDIVQIWKIYRITKGEL